MTPRQVKGEADVRSFGQRARVETESLESKEGLFSAGQGKRADWGLVGARGV